MLYQDCKGRIIHPDDWEKKNLWEIEECEVHIFDE